MYEAEQMRSGRVLDFIEQGLASSHDDAFFIESTRELYRVVITAIPNAATSYDDFKSAILSIKVSNGHQAAICAWLQSMVRSINWPQD